MTGILRRALHWVAGQALDLHLKKLTRLNEEDDQ